MSVARRLLRKVSRLIAMTHRVNLRIRNISVMILFLCEVYLVRVVILPRLLLHMRNRLLVLNLLVMKLIVLLCRTCRLVMRLCMNCRRILLWFCTMPLDWNARNGCLKLLNRNPMSALLNRTSKVRNPKCSALLRVLYMTRKRLCRLVYVLVRRITCGTLMDVCWVCSCICRPIPLLTTLRLLLMNYTLLRCRLALRMKAM